MSGPTSPEVLAGGIEPTEILNTPNEVVQSMPPVVLGNAPETSFSNATAFWSAASPGAGVASAAIQTFALWGKLRVSVISAAAATFTVQFSYDNITWYDLTQDNAGTLFTIATTAGHLNVMRDLPGPAQNWIRLISVAAATGVTAGVTFWGL